MVTHIARLCRLLPAVCLVILFGAAEAAAQGTTALFFQSQAGDYIGAGQTRTYTPADGTFTVDSSGNAVNARLIAPSSSFRWDLYLAAPEPASRSCPASTTPPGVLAFSAYNGLDFSGSGRGCNSVTGRFLVLEAEYGPGGTVVKFAADFEQHCDDADAALFGAIRFNSTIGTLSPFGGAYPDYTLTLVSPANGSITSDGALSCGTGGAACAQTLRGRGVGGPDGDARRRLRLCGLDRGLPRRRGDHGARQRPQTVRGAIRAAGDARPAYVVRVRQQARRLHRQWEAAGLFAGQQHHEGAAEQRTRSTLTFTVASVGPTTGARLDDHDERRRTPNR